MTTTISNNPSFLYGESSFLVKKENFSPEIYINKKKSTISIKGKCINVFSKDLFLEVYKYLYNNKENFCNGVYLEMNVSLLDAGSQRFIYKLIKYLVQIQNSNRNILIRWSHHLNDTYTKEFVVDIIHHLNSSGNIVIAEDDIRQIKN